MELLTLHQYDTIAKKILNKWIQRKGPIYNCSYDEMQGEIVKSLVDSDIKYDENHPAKLSLPKYRIMNAICAIKNVIAYNQRFVNLRHRLYEYNHIPYYYGEEYKEPNQDLKFLINNSGLTDIQHMHVNLFLQDKNTIEIGKILNKTPENATQTLQKAILKMRRVAGV